MSVWVIQDEFTLDDDFEGKIFRGGESLTLRKQSWRLLREMLNARTLGNYKLTLGEFNRLQEGVYKNKATAQSLGKANNEITKVLGKPVARRDGDIFYLEMHAKKKGIQRERILEYFAFLWKTHCTGALRDQISTGQVRELIDYYEILEFTDSRKHPIRDPNNPRTPLGCTSGSIKLVMAGSGFGKTKLMEMALLCQIADPLAEESPSVLSENSRNRLPRYRQIREALFGADCKNLTPIFIYAAAAGRDGGGDLLQLAECKDKKLLTRIVQESNQGENLLFLIDSIDEIETDNARQDFLKQVRGLHNDYPKARIVLTSRFQGKVAPPFACEVLHIKPLEEEAIERIASSILAETDDMEDRIKTILGNRHLRSLASNPYSLMVMLEVKMNLGQLHIVLQNIVNLITERRWKRIIKPEHTRLLFGYVALRMILEQKTSVEKSMIRSYFENADSSVRKLISDLEPETADALLGTLSSQAGILNIVVIDQNEMYVFQDELIQCWLAANYIREVVLSRMMELRGHAAVWEMVSGLDSILREVSGSDPVFTQQLVDTLVIAMVMRGYTNEIQTAFLYYLVTRHAVTLDKDQRRNLISGVESIRDNVFGENRIVGEKDGRMSDAAKLIRQTCPKKRSRSK